MSRLPFRPLVGLVVISIFLAFGCSHDLDAVVQPGQKDIGPGDGPPADVSPDAPLPDGPVPDTPPLDMPLVDLQQDGPAPDSALDQTLTDQTLTDTTPMDQAVVDQTVADQSVVDQSVVDQTVVDQMVMDQVAPDQTVPDQTPPPDLKPTPDMWVCAKAGDACDDNNACTHTDVCSAGLVCVGQTLNCNDGITCTTDTCMGVPYAQGGCSNEVTAGNCYINGVCKKSGDAGSSCNVCDPAFNQYAWAPAKGSNCVVTLTGTSGGTYKDGPLATAQFNNPVGVAVDTAGVIYVADWKNQVVRKIDKGTVSTLAGDGTQGHVDGPGTTARFYEPFDVDVDSSTGTVYVAQVGGNSAGQAAYVRAITKGGVVSTFAGGGKIFIKDGGKFDWRFWKVRGVLVGLQGKIYATDNMHHVVVEISGTQINLFAGSRTTDFKDGLKGSTNGPIANSRFQYPRGLALGPGGVVYVADTGNGMVRKVVPGSSVSTVSSGLVDVGDVAVEMSSGKVYIAEGQGSTTIGHKIKVYDPSTDKTTLLAGSGAKGAANGPGSTASFNDPLGLAVDKNGYVFVADRGNSMIRVINPK